VRGAAILREAARSIATGTARTLTFAIALGLTTLSLLAADLGSVRQLAEEAVRFTESGASVLTVTAVGRIDAAGCERLGEIPEVRAVGALRNAEGNVTVGALPRSPLPLREVSPGFPAVLRSDTVDAPGVILSRDASDLLALSLDGVLSTTAGTTRVAGVFEYPDDGRRPGFGYLALEVTADDRPFDECWVDAWPTLPDLAAILLTTVGPPVGSSQDEQPVLSQLNTSLGRTFEGETRFAQRPTAWAAPVAAVAAFVLAFVSVRIRRMQIASGLHAGVSRRAVYAMLGLETVSWSLPVMVWSLALIAMFTAAAEPGDRAALLLLGARISVLAQLGVLAGAAAAAGVIRERDLFAYFKDR